MNFKIIYLILCLTALPLCISAKNDKEIVPPVENSWNNDKADGDRSLSTPPSLFKNVKHVYVYSEKQLDNVTIGITDMQGNTDQKVVTVQIPQN